MLFSWLNQAFVAVAAFFIWIGTSQQFWTAVIGTLTGAVLAFQFGLWRDKITRRNEQKVAGNVAMTILARQLTEFVRLKEHIQSHRANVLKEFPAAPLWFQILPLQHHFPQSLTYDLKSLGFLFDRKGGARVAEQLIDAETHFYNLAHFLNAHTLVAENVQRKLSESRLDPHVVRPIAEVESTVGYAPIAQMDSLVKAIIEHLDGDEQHYVDAARNLHLSLVEFFGKKGILSISTDHASHG